ADLAGLGSLFPQRPWTALYESLKPGRFANVPLLAWLGPDLFRFLQPADAALQFRYVRHDDREIRPRAMDTDGGSVPWLASGVDGFSAWGYAPAFLVRGALDAAPKCGHG